MDAKVRQSLKRASSLAASVEALLAGTASKAQPEAPLADATPARAPNVGPASRARPPRSRHLFD